MHTLLRIVRVLWIVVYLVLACAPLISNNGFDLVGTISFTAALILFIPWLLGVVFLSFLIWLTKRRF
jgi:hypothetical protein